MKWVFQLTLFLVAVGLIRVPEAGAFTSMYVFGDGVSTTTSNVTTQPELFYGKRFSNGRVWVEVLAQRQSLVIETNQNVSFFGHYSSLLVSNVNKLGPVLDGSTSLAVVWVCNADFIDIINLQHPNPFYPTNMTTWTNGISQSLSNHLTAIQVLYNKGVRTLLMPNGVDVMKIAYYKTWPLASKTFVRQRVIEFNVGFSNLLQQASTSFSNLTIISPDYFGLTDKISAQPTGYGLTNSTESAVGDYGYTSFTGPGTNFVFWDSYHPTAKVHEILADTAQQLISPVSFSGITAVNGSNQLSIVNLPIGLGGIVEGTTNFTTWAPVQGFSSSNATQTVTVPATGALRYYRLRFPFVWTWP